MSPADPLLPLLLAAREGNDAALTELVRRTQPAVWNLCAALGSTDDVADLAQETYERMLRAMHSYEGRAPVRPWLLRIARNVCADAVRRAVRRRRTELRIRPADEDLLVAPSDRSAVDLVDELPPERREAFVLTQHLGLSYGEAADVLGCPIGTVRSRVSRARAELRAAILQSESA